GTITSFYSSARFVGVAFGPPGMSLVMGDYLNISYSIAGGIGVLLLLLVMKFIETSKSEKGQGKAKNAYA
ncbi:hypothetical protein LD39_20600, partial [Halobacillus sp. BBL2006]